MSAVEPRSDQPPPAAACPGPRERPGFLADAAVQLAVLTALAYLGGYSFELGRAEYFGVPSSFVRVGIESILQAGLVVGWFVLAISEMALGLWLDVTSDAESRQGRWANWSLRLPTLVLIGVFFVAFAGWGWSDLRPALVLFAAMMGLAVVVFGSLILLIEGVGRLLRKGRAPEPPQKKPDSGGVFRHIDPFIKRLVFTAVVVVGLCRVFGEGSARRETRFLTCRLNSEDVVVVGTFGEYAVAKDLYRKESAFGQVLRLIPLASMPGAVFEKVGPLRRVGSHLEYSRPTSARVPPAVPSPSATAPVIPAPTPTPNPSPRPRR